MQEPIRQALHELFTLARAGAHNDHQAKKVYQRFETVSDYIRDSDESNAILDKKLREYEDQRKKSPTPFQDAIMAAESSIPTQRDRIEDWLERDLYDAYAEASNLLNMAKNAILQDNPDAYDRAMASHNRVMLIIDRYTKTLNQFRGFGNIGQYHVGVEQSGAALLNNDNLQWNIAEAHGLRKDLR